MFHLYLLYSFFDKVFTLFFIGGFISYTYRILVLKKNPVNVFDPRFMISMIKAQQVIYE
jgi:hypothetical protein